MSEKKFIVNPGDEIVIRIPKKTNRNSSPAAPPSPSPSKKAVLRSRPADDFLPRRLSPGGLLNFYDLGLMKNESGDFVDLDFVISKPTTADNSLSITAPTTADFEDLQNRFFETDLTEWKNTFYKIARTDATDYDLGLKIGDDADETILDETNEKWTADGLKVTKSLRRLRFDYLSAFYAFDTRSAAIKITADPDYESAEVNLNVSKEANIFLVPTLAYQDVEIDLSPKTHILNRNWLIFSRARFKAMDFFKRTFSSSPFTPSDLDDINDWFDFLKTQPAARHLSLVSFMPPPGTVVETEPLADLPAATDDEFLRIEAAIKSVSADQTFAGKLLAVVETPNKNYFIWAKAALSGSKSFYLYKPN